MRARTVWRLMLKDWYLNRIAALLTVAGSAVAIALLALPGGSGLSLGVSLSLGVLIATTFHFPLSSVLGERDQKTLTFLMSLPASPGEYVASKLLSNLSLFLLPWLTIVAGFWVVSQRTESPLAANGFAPVVLLGMVVGFSSVLVFALITESGGWTVALIVTSMFLFGNVFTQILPKFPAVARIFASIATRGPAFAVMLVVECSLVVLLLAAAFLIQSRKQDFL